MNYILHLTKIVRDDATMYGGAVIVSTLTELDWAALVSEFVERPDLQYIHFSMMGASRPFMTISREQLENVVGGTPAHVETASLHRKA